MASPNNLDELIAMGYRFLSLGADVVGLSQYCKAIMSEFAKRPALGGKSIHIGKMT